MADRRYALIASKVWDGCSSHAQEGVAVVVEGHKIEAILQANLVPRNIETIRFPEGSTLLPGLIDAHVHYSPWMGPAFLAAGVTAVRDVGNDLEWILAQQGGNRADVRCGPEIVCCGVLLDGPKPYWHFIGRGHQDAFALRASIRQEAERGIRFVKFYDGLDQDFIREGVQEARELDLWVLADFGTDEPKAEDAVRAGVNEIEHLTGCPPAWNTSTQEERDRLIDLLLAHQVVMTPTLVTYDHIGRALDLTFRFDSRQAWAHPAYREIWNRIPQVGRQERAEQRHKFQEAAAHQKRFVRRLYERQAALAVGTDTPFSFIVPGFSVHDELSMLVDAGLTPVDALRSATSINAALLGKGNVVGQIKPGFTADLIVVASSPLADIHNITNIECVVRRGMVLSSDDLKRRSSAQFSQTPDDPITRDLLRYLASTTGARALS